MAVIECFLTYQKPARSVVIPNNDLLATIISCVASPAAPNPWRGGQEEETQKKSLWLLNVVP